MWLILTILLKTGIISGTSRDRGGVVSAILSTPTYAPIWDPARPGQYYTDFYGVNVDGPLENIARTKDNKSQYNKLLATGKFIVTFIPELTLTSTISFDRSSSIVTNFLDPKLTREGRNQNGTGYDGRSTGTVWTIDNVLNWKKNFDKHGLDAMAVLHGRKATGARTISMDPTMPTTSSAHSTLPIKSVGVAPVHLLPTGRSFHSSVVCNTTGTARIC